MLADPGGNELCVIEPSNNFLAGTGYLGEVTCDGTRAAGLFWRDALGWPLVWDENEQTAIQSPLGGTKISWDSWKTARRTHAKENPAALRPRRRRPSNEAERLVSLGATLLSHTPAYVELADPMATSSACAQIDANPGRLRSASTIEPLSMVGQRRSGIDRWSRLTGLISVAGGAHVGRRSEDRPFRRHGNELNVAVASDVSLRPITVEDWPAVHEWASTEEACRYQPWGPNTPAETQAFVEEAVAAWHEVPQSRYVWIAEEAAEVVGLGELKIRSRRWQQGEIAYAVKVGQWRRGIGSAIATELLTRAFGSFGLHRVAATCDPRNQASAAVLAKVGMVYEGRLRHTIRIRDGWRDSDVYSILAHEWAPPSPPR